MKHTPRKQPPGAGDAGQCVDNSKRLDKEKIANALEKHKPAREVFRDWPAVKRWHAYSINIHASRSLAEWKASGRPIGDVQ